MESDAGRSRSRPVPEAPEAQQIEVKQNESPWEEWLEFFPSVLMALAVVLTAYSAYEATRWSGVQATDFATAGSLRAQATSLTTVGATQVAYDANMLGELLLAFRGENLADPAVQREAIAFADELFRDEAKVALEEWIDLDPLNNPAAPSTPLEVDSYSNANLEEAERLVAQAEQSFNDAKRANQTGDDYILATILFASVLFFTGLRIKTNWVRGLIEAFATLCLIGGIARLLTLPFE